MRIYVDCDDVLADFNAAICHLHGWPEESQTSWTAHKDQFGLTHEQFMEPMVGLGAYGAFALKPLPWAQKLWEVCQAQALPFRPPAVATAPWASPEAWGGRVRWLREKMGIGFGDMVLCSSQHKISLATHRGPIGNGMNVLIDDREDTVRAFCAAGGAGLLWPAHWNELRDLVPEIRKDCNHLLMDLVRTISLVRDHGIRVDPVRWAHWTKKIY
jgi:hypothetical protein